MKSKQILMVNFIIGLAAVTGNQRTAPAAEVSNQEIIENLDLLENFQLLDNLEEIENYDVFYEQLPASEVGVEPEDEPEDFLRGE